MIRFFQLSTHSTYDLLRHLADSWGLMIMALVFLALCLWPFRPGGRAMSRDAALSIFEDDSDDA
ncbi:cytochrome C oxidase Cbb3 [Novosphingobium fuchskuhlense]|uniref:Cytochrome C oxidase Cbb3 n=1 Tax=Novosphingobium fuchskuhlense TaxID=1117702 RepID=A0A117UTD6_9SPHN|nr:cbb3-type cytochrome c oxidase subunit 3 [Novosphingobium fuchskuhlense]KUR70499.1 cytochrome C oxidase Cbb3 [Novosphingobium fuchskuhlense]